MQHPHTTALVAHRFTATSAIFPPPPPPYLRLHHLQVEFGGAGGFELDEDEGETGDDDGPFDDDEDDGEGDF